MPDGSASRCVEFGSIGAEIAALADPLSGA